MSYSRSICTVNISGIKSAAKKLQLKEFIAKHKCDIVFLQEVAFTEFKEFNGYQPIANTGTAPRGTAVLIRDGINVPDHTVMKSGSDRIISFAVGQILYINVYPKSGTHHRHARRELFQEEIYRHLHNPVHDSSIKYFVMGGDFNCIIDPADTTSLRKDMCHELKHLLEAQMMEDMCSKHADDATCQFTFHRKYSASRLDRFYMSKELLEKFTDFKVVPVCFIKDHYAVIIQHEVELTSCRGRGNYEVPMSLSTLDSNVRQGTSNDSEFGCPYNVDLDPGANNDGIIFISEIGQEIRGDADDSFDSINTSQEIVEVDEAEDTIYISDSSS